MDEHQWRAPTGRTGRDPDVDPETVHQEEAALDLAGGWMHRGEYRGSEGRGLLGLHGRHKERRRWDTTGRYGTQIAAMGPYGRLLGHYAGPLGHKKAVPRHYDSDLGHYETLLGH